MAERKSLPVQLDRRLFLLASSGACAAACGGPVARGEDAARADVDASPAPDDAPTELGPVPDARPPCEDSAWQTLGPVANYPVGTHARDATVNLIITRDSRGLWAMRATCSHQFGAIAAEADGSNRCTNMAGGPRPNYPAVFDADGVMLVEPGGGRFNLDNYAVRVCEGAVQVNLGTVVPAGTRAPVP